MLIGQPKNRTVFSRVILFSVLLYGGLVKSQDDAVGERTLCDCEEDQPVVCIDHGITISECLLNCHELYNLQFMVVFIFLYRWTPKV